MIASAFPAFAFRRLVDRQAEAVEEGKVPGGLAGS